MRTPQRVERVEFEADLLAAIRLCAKCGAPPKLTLVYLSLHISEFESCAGPGRVWEVFLPWCPQCEPEPEQYGCVHMPADLLPQPVLTIR